MQRWRLWNLQRIEEVIRLSDLFMALWLIQYAQLWFSRWPAGSAESTGGHMGSNAGRKLWISGCHAVNGQRFCSYLMHLAKKKIQDAKDADVRLENCENRKCIIGPGFIGCSIYALILHFYSSKLQCPNSIFITLMLGSSEMPPIGVI